MGGRQGVDKDKGGGRTKGMGDRAEPFPLKLEVKKQNGEGGEVVTTTK